MNWFLQSAGPVISCVPYRRYWANRRVLGFPNRYSNDHPEPLRRSLGFAIFHSNLLGSIHKIHEVPTSQLTYEF